MTTIAAPAATIADLRNEAVASGSYTQVQVNTTYLRSCLNSEHGLGHGHQYVEAWTPHDVTVRDSRNREVLYLEADLPCWKNRI